MFDNEETYTQWLQCITAEKIQHNMLYLPQLQLRYIALAFQKKEEVTGFLEKLASGKMVSSGIKEDFGQCLAFEPTKLDIGQHTESLNREQRSGFAASL